MTVWKTNNKFENASEERINIHIKTCVIAYKEIDL